jgi:hypothetical protein
MKGVRAEFQNLILGEKSPSSSVHRQLSKPLRRMLARIFDRYIFNSTKTYKCNLKTISDIICENNINTINLLKIDVENSEWDVLEGIKEVDYDKIKQVVVEVHDIEGRLERIVRRFDQQGYRVEVDQEELLRGFGIFNVYGQRP